MLGLEHQRRATLGNCAHDDLSRGRFPESSISLEVQRASEETFLKLNNMIQILLKTESGSYLYYYYLP